MTSARPVLAASTALIAAALMPIAAAAQGATADNAFRAPSFTTISSECSISKVSFKSSDQSASTTSRNFVPIPETSFAFTQGGADTGCIIVTFSAMTFAGTANSHLLFVRPILDGDTTVPSNVQFSGDDDEDGDRRYSRTHSMTWAFPKVAPGEHRLQMQFRTRFAGQVVGVSRRTTVIYHD